MFSFYSKTNKQTKNPNSVHQTKFILGPVWVSYFFSVLVTNFIKKYKKGRISLSLAVSSNRVNSKIEAIAAASLGAWRILFSLHPPGPFWLHGPGFLAPRTHPKLRARSQGSQRQWILWKPAFHLICVHCFLSLCRKRKNPRWV